MDDIEKLFYLEKEFYNSNNLYKYIVKNKMIIIYGAGTGFFTFKAFIIDKFNLKIEIVLDKKFIKKQYFLGYNANTLDNFDYDKKKLEDYMVIITLGDKKEFEKVYKKLKQKGFKYIISPNEIYEYHLHYTKQNDSFEFFLQNKNNIIAAFKLFSDDISKKVFYNVLKTHIIRKPLKIPHDNILNQYFPNDIDFKKGYDRFVNCGAYDGDTIEQLCNRYKKIKFLMAIEPDKENFIKLKNFLHNKKNIADEILLLNKGVYSKNIVLSFQNGYKVNSFICDNSNNSIECILLDDILINKKPTFIQMDIEGSEFEALKGAEKVIKKYKPDLAICVYHYIQDLWRIPLFINNMVKGYKFYLRNYTGYISETVLYVTSKE